MVKWTMAAAFSLIYLQAKNLCAKDSHYPPGWCEAHGPTSDYTGGPKNPLTKAKLTIHSGGDRLRPYGYKQRRLNEARPVDPSSLKFKEMNDD